MSGRDVERLVRAALLGAVFLIVFWIGRATGQTSSCLPSDDVAKLLREQHGEARALDLVLSNGGLLVLYVNPKTETWTIAVSPPGQPGIQCPTGMSGTGATRKS